MSLLWPWTLLCLILIPLGIALYVWMLRRKRRFAVRYSSLALVRAAMPARQRWRRHLPFGLFMLGLTTLVLAMARPVAAITVPQSRASIILAMDVSRSMCATDVPPNRLTVAQEAAQAFIADQAAGTQIGIVAFTGFAEIIVPPTNDKDTLNAAVDNFTTALGTAIGSAILKSIDAIAAINDAVAPSGVNLRAGLPAYVRATREQLVERIFDAPDPRSLVVLLPPDLPADPDDERWAKLCFEYAPTDRPMVVSVVTRGKSDDCNSVYIDDNSVYLRLYREGDRLAFHYSEDGEYWHMVRHFTIGDLQDVRIGFSVQAPTGEGCHWTFA